MIIRKKSIETERTILREFKLGDEYEMFSNWASDHEVVKYLTWPIHENVEVTKQIIQMWVNQYQDPTTIRFGITLKDSGELWLVVNKDHMYNNITCDHSYNYILKYLEHYYLVDYSI